MLLTKQEIPEKEENSEVFGNTSKFIKDELELIHGQHESVSSIALQLDKAFSQTEKMRKLMKVVKKADKMILGTLDEKKKKESQMIHQIENMKDMLKEERFESIDRYLYSIQRKSQKKLRLSQQELVNLRELVSELNEVYQEASGFCKLYQVVYEKLKTVYDMCKDEMEMELSEEDDLNKAGNYSGDGSSKVVSSLSFRNLLGNGIERWLNRF